MQTVSRSYNAANQVVGWTYDAAGKLLSHDRQQYTWDALNRLTQSQHGSSVTTMQYNGDGVLVAQAHGGVVSHYTQDLAAPLSQILRVQEGSSTTTAIYGMGAERLATVSGSDWQWPLVDALGTPKLTLDSTGAPLTSNQYDAWGAPATGTVPDPFGFTGELHDADTGLVYLRARWYQPGEGTLAQRAPRRDPFAGYPQQPYSLHPYQYAYAQPTRWTDPSGRDPWWYEWDPYDLDGIGWEEDYDAKCRYTDYFSTLAGHEYTCPLDEYQPGNFWAWCADQIGLDSDGSTSPYPVGQRMTIVELGVGNHIYNLVNLAADPRYQNAELYGVDQDTVGTSGFLSRSGVSRDILDRIHFINSPFETLNDPHVVGQANIVVVAGPLPGAERKYIDGIDLVAKYGAQVVILTSDPSVIRNTRLLLTARSKTFTETVEQAVVVTPPNGITYGSVPTPLGLELGSEFLIQRQTYSNGEITTYTANRTTIFYISSW